MESIGAELLAGAISVALFFGCAAGGIKIANKTNSAAYGWAAGVALFIASVAIFGSTIRDLREKGCEGADDYASCVNGGEEEYP